MKEETFSRLPEKYVKILNMPHHVSVKHPPMSGQVRAAQFAPFAALGGYEELLNEENKDAVVSLDTEPDDWTVD